MCRHLEPTVSLFFLRIQIFFYVLCFVDRASRYICVTKTNLMHYLSSVYFLNQPPHVSAIFVVHHQESHLNPANRVSTEKRNTYQLLYINSIPPDEGLQICRKRVEVDEIN